MLLPRTSRFCFRDRCSQLISACLPLADGEGNAPSPDKPVLFSRQVRPTYIRLPSAKIWSPGWGSHPLCPRASDLQSGDSTLQFNPGEIGGRGGNRTLRLVLSRHHVLPLNYPAKICGCLVAAFTLVGYFTSGTNRPRRKRRGPLHHLWAAPFRVDRLQGGIPLLSSS